jgi:hypothetical protein
MARRLKTIAKWINENIPELHAHVQSTTVSTDRKMGRLRWPGKGRTGNRLVVRRVRGGGEVVLDHNAAETYRTNDEVEAWLARWVAGECTGTWCGTKHDSRCRLAGQRNKKR